MTGMNGKPGDHPLTDILSHQLGVFGPSVDGVIRDIVELGGGDDLEHEFELLKLDPRLPDNRPADLTSFEARLTQLREQLIADRRDRGWEV